MSLGNERREVLTEHYDYLAEELYILYQSLVKTGFEKDQAFDIMLNIYLAPTHMSKQEVMERSQKLIKERLERIKRYQEEKEDGTV